MGFTARTTYCYLCSTSHGQTCLWMSTENMSMPLPPKDNTVRFNFKFPTFVVFIVIHDHQRSGFTVCITMGVRAVVLIMIMHLYGGRTKRRTITTAALLPYPLTFTTTLVSKVFAHTGWIGNTAPVYAHCM
ncbi:hypothetical protein F5141DRAFT_1142322 [Pisolithus sp. B1]|nr:hypothetical protein F5141DRAFT_1142322 [Pisolithus sp. B1]